MSGSVTLQSRKIDLESDQQAAGSSLSEHSISSNRQRMELSDTSINYPRALNQTSNFQDLNSVQKEQVARIYNSLDYRLSNADKAELINDLLNRKDKEGKLIISSEFKGETLLKHLDSLASKPLSHKLSASGVDNQSVLTSLIQDLASASNIDQGKRATCTVTALQWEMCLFDPARYAGLVSKLSSDGGIQLKRGYLPVGDYVHDDKRSASSMIFQNSLMAAASDHGYKAESDMVAGRTALHKGLYARQVEGVCELVYEKPHTRIDVGTTQFHEKLSQLPKITASIRDLRSGAVSLPQATCAYTTCIEGLGRNEHLLHVVSTTHSLTDPTTGKKYYCFRNPWGKNHLTDGQGGAILIDKKNSIYAISEEEFSKRTTYIMSEGGIFGTTPNANDEYIEQPANFFTTDEDPEEQPVETDLSNPETNNFKSATSNLVQINPISENRIETYQAENEAWKAAAAAQEEINRRNARRRKNSYLDNYSDN